MTTTDLPYYPMPRQNPFDPPAELGRIQAEAPVTRVQIWDGSTPWLITRYDDVCAVLADRRFSADPNRPGYPSVAASRAASQDRARTPFIFMDDPEHARYRKPLLREFTVRRIEALRPLVRQTVTSLLDAMAEGPRATDLMQTFALPVPSLVICHLLGVPYSDHAFFQRHSNAPFDLNADRDAVIAAVDVLHDYLGKLIDERVSEPRDDLISRLAARIPSGELTREDVCSMAFLLLVAGHETTANMIGLGTLTLLHHPEQAAAVRDGDPAVVRATVEELLRVLTVAHLGRRRVAMEDVTVGDALIRAGEGVILATEVANRDPHKHQEPDELDVTRRDNQHVAFGFGIHQCLGQSLARVELQIAYPALLRRFPDLRVTGPLADIPFRTEMAVYGVHALPVAWG